MEANNKTMREALTKILDLTNSLDEDCAVDPVEIRDIAKAALSAPARNCDVGTPETQVVRMSAFCRKHQPHGEITNCPSCPIKSGNYFLCALRWAQMPYEEGGAK